MKDLALSLLTNLAPLVIAGLVAWLGAHVARYIKDRRYALAMELAAMGAASIVADLAQTLVAGLKDPSKPGTWNETTAASMRLRAVSRLRTLYPNAIATIAGVLRDPARVDELLGSLVEKAVVDAKAGPSAVAINESVTVEAPAAKAADPQAVRETEPPDAA